MVEFRGGVIPQSITEFGESTPTTLVTEGNYLLEVGGLVAGMNRTTGEAFASFRTKIVDGPIGLPQEGAGMPVWAIQSFFEAEDPSKTRAWAAGQMLAAMGLTLEEIGALRGVKFPGGVQGYKMFQAFCQNLSKQLTGRRLGAVLTTYTGGRSPVSQISRPFSATEFLAQKAVAGEPRAQASSPSESNGAVSDDEIASQLGALLTQQPTT